MKTNRMNFAIALLLCCLCLPFQVMAQGQQQQMPPCLKGQAVATCFSGHNPSIYNQILDAYVVGIVDIHQPVGPGTVSAWPAPMYHGPANSWKASLFGQVYGIAIDKRNNIYLTATTSYGNTISDPLAFGAGGSGGVYKIDGVTGVGSVLISTANYTQTPAASVGGTTIPNGNGTTVKTGLGNICYDATHDKLFVTNLEDGVIYSINALTGIIDGFYDPTVPANPLGTSNPAMVADNGTLGFAPLGERIWGIGYNAVEKRLYYAVWMEDLSGGAATTKNIIRSIGLTATGAFNAASDDKPEILLPDFSTSNNSAPVADIEFSSAGKMLVGECSMGGPTGRGAHSSRVFQFSGLSTTWGAPQQIFVGAGISFANSSGGVDFGYGKEDSLKCVNSDCDSVLWMSGDYLAFPPGFPGVYGLQRTPATGNTVANVQSTGYFIDLNAVAGTQDKTQIGDVDVFRDACGSSVPTAPCSEVRVAAKVIQNGAVGGPCCYNVQISNTLANYWTNVTAQAISPGFTFGSATVPAGWSLTNSGTLANWMPPGAFVPVRVTDSLILCISSMTNPPQKVEIVWHGANGEVCRDTLTFDCSKAVPPIPPCAIVQDSILNCTQANQGAYTYQYCIKIKNNSPFSQSPYFYPAENLLIWSSTPNVNVSPGSFTFAPVPFGGSTGLLCVTFSGTGVTPGAPICIVVQLHGAKNAQGDGYQWCCPPDTVCFTLPPCKDCCEGFKKSFSNPNGLPPFSLTTNGAGVATLTTNLTSAPSPIVKFTATIVSADIKRFGGNKYCQNTAWLSASGDIINPQPLVGVLPLTTTPPQFASAPPAPYREAIWGVVPSGYAMTNTPFALQMQFPAPPTPIFGCYDSLRICVRFTYTDVNCRTCDTLICFQIRRVGKWIYHDVGTVDIGVIKMTSKTQGTLTVDIPKLPAGFSPEDGIRVNRLVLEGGSGIRLTSFDGKPAPNFVGTKSVSLANGDQASVALVYDNYADQRTFDNLLTYTFVQVSNPQDTMTETVHILATVPGASAGDVFAKDDSSAVPGNVRTYALYFANRNQSKTVVHEGKLTVSDGNRILAMGPFEDTASVSYSAMNSALDGKARLYPKGSPWFVDGPECKIAYGSVIRPIYLTIAGNTGKTVVVHYTTSDENGGLLTSDSVMLSDPLTIVRKNDPSAMRPSGYLYPPYPNPSSGSTTVQFHLESADHVTVVVMNLLGNEVARIVDNEFFSNGEHVFTFNPGTLSSGEYILRMQTTSGAQSQTLQILH